MKAQFTHRSYTPNPIMSRPLTRLTQRECRAKNIVIGFWSAPPRKERMNKGKPNPSPNHKKVPNLAMNAVLCKLIANIDTTNGPEQGKAIGP